MTAEVVVMLLCLGGLCVLLVVHLARMWVEWRPLPRGCDLRARCPVCGTWHPVTARRWED